jgi:phosphoribosylglycinamide formyltransferase-1
MRRYPNIFIDLSPDLILLAGFMRILDKDLVNHFAGKMINIHPSLLPSFPGLNTHQSALNIGVKQTSVHFVTSELMLVRLLHKVSSQC